MSLTNSRVAVLVLVGSTAFLTSPLVSYRIRAAHFCPWTPVESLPVVLLVTFIKAIGVFSNAFRRVLLDVSAPLKLSASIK